MAPAYQSGDEPVPGYFLEEFLGEGNFGVVWKARGPGRVRLALKIINLGAKQGRKEFRALARVKLINHPNLVPIHSFWLKNADGQLVNDSDDDGLIDTVQPPVKATMLVRSSQTRPSELIIAMSLGEKTLGQRLEECQRAGLPGIPIDELLVYMESAARAIDFLNIRRHDLDGGKQETLQHCDIKPQNIMIVGGDAQVCDFGLVRDPNDVRATTTAVTLAYGAPELFLKNAPSSSTDQYSLAVSYVELRTGRLPFANSESHMAVMEAHRTGNLDLEHLMPLEREVIRRATALEPSGRFPTTGQMVQALRIAHAEQGDEGAAAGAIHGRPDPEIAALRSSAALAVASGSRSLRESAKATNKFLDGDTLPDEELAKIRGRGRRRWVVVALLLCLAAAGGGGWLAFNEYQKRESAARQAIDALLAEAQQDWDSNAASALGKLDEAEKLLVARGGGAVDPERWQTMLLARARSKTRLADSDSSGAAADLKTLETSLAVKNTLSPTQSALRHVLAVICLPKDATADKSLALAGQARKALSASGDMQAVWYPTDGEQHTVELVAQRGLDELSQAVESDIERRQFSDALPKCERILEFRPNDYRALWAKGDAQTRLGKLKQAVETLELARSHAPDEAHGTQAAELRDAAQAVQSLTEGRDKTPAELAADLNVTRKFAPRMSDELALRYAEVVSGLADNNKAADEDLVSVATVLHRLPASMPNVPQLAEKFEKLVGASRLYVWSQTWKAIDSEQPDFKDFALRYEAAQSQGPTPGGSLGALLQLGWIESQIELGQSKLSPDERHKLQRTLGQDDLAEALADDAKDQAYLKYVGALALANLSPSGNSGAAAEQMLAVFDVEPLPACLHGARSQRAASLLTAAAGERIEQELKAAEATRAENPLAPMFADHEDAQRVYRWLTKARQLAGQLSPRDRLWLALAAARMQPRDDNLAREMFASLSAADLPSGPASIPILLSLASVQAEDQPGAVAALDAYYRVMSQADQLAKASSHELAVAAVFQQVLAPALAPEVGRVRQLTDRNSLTPEQRQHVAKLFAALGRLLRHHSGEALGYETWQLKDRDESLAASLQAYGESIDFAPSPLAYVGRGAVRLLPGASNSQAAKGELDQAEADLKRAPEAAEAHYWLAEIARRREANSKGLAKALQHCDEALEKDAEFYPALALKGRCLAQLERAAEADEQFGKAFRLAKDRDQGQAYHYLYDWSRTIPRDAKEFESRKKALTAAAVSLRSDPTAEAQLFQGMVRRAERKFDAAVVLFDSGASAPSGAGIDRRYDSLLLSNDAACSEIEVQKGAAQKALAQRLKASLIEQADELVALAAENPQPPTADAAKDRPRNNVALAHWQAGRCRLLFFDVLGDGKLGIEGLQRWQKAIEAAHSTPATPQLLRWRYELVKRSLGVDPQYPQTAAQLAQAETYLGDYKNRLPLDASDQRREVETLLTELRQKRASRPQ